jgi:hypothetical protein
VAELQHVDKSQVSELRKEMKKRAMGAGEKREALVALAADLEQVLV